MNPIDDIMKGLTAEVHFESGIMINLKERSIEQA